MNRIVFITGATSGIGEACAHEFAAHGDRLILNGRRESRLEALKTTLQEAHGTKIICLPFDVSDREATTDAIGSLPGEWKAIDILINNAGLAAGRDLFADADIADWEKMIDTNVKGILYVSKAVLPGMISKNKGHIINIGSIAGDEVYERGNVYCATKSAVDALTRAMRVDLLSHNIKVTNIKPGAAETEFSLVRFKGDAAEASKVYAGLQPLVAADIAPVIYHCTTLPAHVCINELTITPTAQANSIYSYRS